MARKRPQPKAWVPLDAEPLFDQTNGIVDLDVRAEGDDGADLRRLIDAGVITLLATGTSMGGW